MGVYSKLAFHYTSCQINKLGKAASRFVMLDGVSQLQPELAPDAARVKKYLVFRELSEEEQREMEDKMGLPGQTKKARRSRAKAKTQPQAETSEGNGDGAGNDTNFKGEDQDTNTRNQDFGISENDNGMGGEDGCYGDKSEEATQVITGKTHDLFPCR